MSSSVPIKQEFSAGGCVFKRLITENGEPKTVWLLGKHSGYHKWVLPKGMIEAGETAEQTAVRETQEEVAVTAKIVRSEPVHLEKYSYQAEQAKSDKLQATSNHPVRRVQTYQEDPDFDNEGLEKVTIAKTVTFFLMKYVSGDPDNHGWEMEDAGWFEVKEALNLMAFEGEKKALQQAAALV